MKGSVHKQVRPLLPASSFTTSSDPSQTFSSLFGMSAEYAAVVHSSSHLLVNIDISINALCPLDWHFVGVYKGE